MVDGARTMPRHVAIAIVSLSQAGQNVFGHSKLTLYISVRTACRDLIVIHDLFASDDDPGTELSEDRTRGDNTDLPTFVRVRKDVAVDPILSGLVGEDDLEQLRVFLEEEITVPIADAARRLG